MQEEDTNVVADATPAAAAPAGEPDVKAKLFVGNLSWNTKDENLKQAFEQFGQVLSAEVVIERATGRSKGFGFVQMAKAEDANAAAEKMNGQELDGRALTVNIARPKTERSDRDDRGGYRN